jgi:hypothetical protein
VPITVLPTNPDKEIARLVARQATPVIEESAQTLIWGLTNAFLGRSPLSSSSIAADNLNLNGRGATMF